MPSFLRSSFARSGNSVDGSAQSARLQARMPNANERASARIEVSDRLTSVTQTTSKGGQRAFPLSRVRERVGRGHVAKALRRTSLPSPRPSPAERERGKSAHDREYPASARRRRRQS